VRPYFEVRLEDVLPQRARKVTNAIRELRGGRMNDPRFGSRMRGEGARWRAIEQLFETHVRRLGLDRASVADDLGPRPEARPRGQLSLF
jgi:hypothetical protein